MADKQRDVSGRCQFIGLTNLAATSEAPKAPINHTRDRDRDRDRGLDPRPSCMILVSDPCGCLRVISVYDAAALEICQINFA